MERRSALAALAAALLLSACAHNLASMSVVGTDTGVGRDFTYEAATHRLEASGPEGPIVRFWTDTKEIWIKSGQIRREVPPGCDGGFIYLYEGPNQKKGRVAVILCPRDGAPAGWTGWHASLEELTKVTGEKQIPTSALSFDLQPSADGTDLVVATETSKVKVSLPQSEASFFRVHPELLAFALVSGAVPPSRVGTYAAKDE